MRGAPIGVFDSGVGGLTVLKALVAELPHEHFVYLGDTARLPYGTKSPETVARYAVQAAEALSEYGVKCLVIACNTASSVGLPAIREHIRSMPIIGVIEPGAQAACAASRTGRIAVIATEGTVRGGAYQEAILRIRGHAHVIAQPTQLFVALAEEGLHEGPIADSVARHYLDPIFRAARDALSSPAMLTPPDRLARPDIPAPPNTTAPPDTLVLGCTHFPMLASAIRAAVGPTIQIVDSAATTAKSVRETLQRESLMRPDASTDSGSLSGPAATCAIRFLATDSVERFVRIGTRFLERPIDSREVELIDL
ncbi:MAG TPA: glutamate racemase [Steroidobacteraceae bacterium]|nr:glutamate racemase [Steroidobacteraceae bacterium]